MRNFLLLSLFILLSATASIAATPDTEMLEKARRAYSNHEWASSAALYTQVSDKDPEAIEPYVRRILAWDVLGDSAEVASTFDEAVEGGVSTTRLLEDLRQGAFALGRGDSYPKLLNIGRQTIPWLARTFDAALLDYYEFRRNPAETIAYAETLLAGLPDDTEYLSTLALGYLDAGDYSKAMEVYEKILTIQPDNTEALLMLGNYYRETDPARALGYLERACIIAPTPYLRATIKSLRHK